MNDEKTGYEVPREESLKLNTRVEDISPDHPYLDEDGTTLSTRIINLHERLSLLSSFMVLTYQEIKMLSMEFQSEEKTAKSVLEWTALAQDLKESMLPNLFRTTVADALLTEEDLEYKAGKRTSGLMEFAAR